MRSINGAISNDLERTLTLFQGQAIFDIKYITNGYRYGHNYYRSRTAPKLLNGTTVSDIE